MSTCSGAQAERLAKAIRIPTVSIVSPAPASDPGYAHFAAFERLLQREFPLAAVRLRWERLGDFALLLTWKGSADSPAARPLLFYAHYDVVPPGDESKWSHPPFSGDIADGFVWGRGTLDDKNCLMGVMEAVEGLLAEDFAPSRTVHLAFGGDEELTGVNGAVVIRDAMRKRGERLACLIDEGSIVAKGMLSFVALPLAMFGVAEKGFANVRLTVHGAPGHSSRPGPHTAAGALAAVLTALERRPFPLRLTPTVARFFRSLAPHAKGPLRLVLRLIGPLWPLVRTAMTADPSVDSLLRTTQAITVLRAGDRENVLPAEASAIVNLRILPGDATAGALARVDAVARRSLPRGFKLETGFLEGEHPSEPTPEKAIDPALWAGLCAAARDAVPEAAVVPFLVTALTDSRWFAGIADAIIRFMPTVLDSTDLARMHGIDERISLENYGRMISFYRSVMMKIASRS